MAFLNEQGLERLWSHIIAKLGSKIDKVDGKGLSTNDYTDEDKNKLTSVETAVGELNTLVGDESVSDQISAAIGENIKQADWNQSNSEAADYIKNKPNVLKYDYQYLTDYEKYRARANIGAAVDGSYTTLEKKDYNRNFTYDTIFGTFQNKIYGWSFQDSYVVVSSDGINWERIYTGIEEWNSSISRQFICSSPNAILFFYSVDGDCICIRYDGNSWQNITIPKMDNENNLYWVSAAYENNRFVLIGHDYENENIIVAYSDDEGQSWERAITDCGYDGRLNHINSYNGKFIVNGVGGLMSSTDGITWSSDMGDFNSGNSDSFIYVFNNTYLAIIGNELYVAEAVDSQPNWSNEIRLYEFPKTVIYGNGKYLMQFRYSPSVYALSENGIDWNLINFPEEIEEIDSIQDIVFHDGKFIIGTSHYGFFISEDGINWINKEVIAITQSGQDVTEDVKTLLGFVSKEYVDNAISSIPTPDVSGQITSHNTDGSAHNDIRTAISDLNALVGDEPVSEQINTAVDKELDKKLDKIDYLGPVIMEGSSVSYDDCFESLLINVETTFSPIQEGSGESSPDNIRKIAGYNSLRLMQEAQSNIVYFTPFGGRDIYGGKLNWNTGTLTVEWELLTLTGSDEEFSNWSYETIDGVQSSRFELNKKSTGDICICSHFSQVDKGEALYSSANGVIISQDFIHFYVDKIAPGQFDFVNSYLPAQNSAGTPVQIAYKLAVPQKISVASAKIISFQGKNTIWGDGDSHRAIFNFSNGNTIGQAGVGENAEVFNGNISGNATGAYSHAEGKNTVAAWEASHAEGLETYSGYTGTHAEGVKTKAHGVASHSEGYMTLADGEAAHAEGYETVAYSDYSHAEGKGTYANGLYQHVQGMFNVKDSDRYIHIVGLGADDDHRANIHTLSYLGEAWFSGDVYTGSTSGINRDPGSKKLATEEYVDTKINSTPKSNWNQNDPEAIDYIENRPFYTETLEVYNEILSRARFPGSYDVSNFVSVLNNPLIPGQKYRVTWSDINNPSNTPYDCIARSFGNGYVMIGNAAIYEHNNGDTTDTGEPFALYSLEGDVQLRLNLANPSLHCIFSISAITEETNIHKIPEEYLPDEIVSKEYVDSAISDLNTLVGDESVAEQIAASQIIYVGPTQPTDPNIKVWINTAEEGTGVIPVLPRIATITLSAANWTGASAPYSQVVEINTVTSATKVELNPTAAQIVSLQNDDIALMAENDGGIVTIYSFGGKPSTDMALQATLMEVSYV